MPPVIPAVEFPEQLRPYAAELGSFFPEDVEFDRDHHEVKLKKPGSFGFQVASSFLKLVSDVRDVTSNLNIVLTDLAGLASAPPSDPTEGERRYILLTKLFFYELLRLRDALPRFLARMEDLGVMGKKERHETKKLLEHQFSEHYLIRNVYLHGHTVPRSDKEFDLKFTALLFEHGYEPELHPKDGTPSKRYPALLVELAASRVEALHTIGSDVITFVQAIMTGAAVWIAHHKLPAHHQP